MEHVGIIADELKNYSLEVLENGAAAFNSVLQPRWSPLSSNTLLVK